MRRWIVLLCFSVLLISACREGASLKGMFQFGNEQLKANEFNTIVSNDEFSLIIPKYMKRDTTLHPDALVAYKHNRKELGVLVISEALPIANFRLRQDSLFVEKHSIAKNFILNEFRSMAGKLQNPIFGPLVETETSKFYTVRARLDGKIDHHEISYLAACIATSEKIFFIICYCPEEKKEKFEGTFLQIINSFTLLEAEV
jgi:hypothetical protein